MACNVDYPSSPRSSSASRFRVVLLLILERSVSHHHIPYWNTLSADSHRRVSHSCESYPFSGCFL